ncbi:helix-turn-helix domain-containing protein [Iningainema tapete]|uniref:Transcriptional regulator n=1 Tax=Iningainema tapete BLCC-T55 TaxID=2748662 RepID=A0A8J7C669_9CYAN|nr:transcriptional regulator [Iningainema tapete]MBD2771646.1 transcriptional regulator [Iningainema tapete BLCC-T55]
MTSTFDSKSYTDLLVRYQPKPITTEVENEEAIALAQNLEYRPNRTPEEDTFLELLVTLIEKFEANHYPIPTGTPTSMLRHLIDARNIDEKDLIPVLGTYSAIAEIFNHEKEINTAQAKALAEFFHVDVSLFQESR